jgi:hypothetical protein
MGLMHVRMSEIQTIELTNAVGGVTVPILLNPVYGLVSDYVVVSKHGKTLSGAQVVVEVGKFTDHVDITPDIDASEITVVIAPKTT